MLVGSAGAIEPSGSSDAAADPFAKRGGPNGSQPAAAAPPSKVSAGVAQLAPIETPYVPYHATATSPWSPRAVDPPPGEVTTAPYEEPTSGSLLESIFDPARLVPVVLPEAPPAPTPATGGTGPDGTGRYGESSQSGGTSKAPDVYAAPLVDTGKMTPVTFGEPKADKPANPASPTKKKAAAKLNDDDLEQSVADPLGKPDAEKPEAMKPAAAKPAAPRPPVTAKYHLPQPPIPLP